MCIYAYACACVQSVIYQYICLNLNAPKPSNGPVNTKNEVSGQGFEVKASGLLSHECPRKRCILINNLAIPP